MALEALVAGAQQLPMGKRMPQAALQIPEAAGVVVITTLGEVVEAAAQE